MSLLTLIKAQFGKSNTPANNFVLDASADNGTMKLARGNAGATTQDILTVDASGNVLVGGNNLNLFSAKSLATSGYQKLPSGLIIQWGASAVGAVTFPIAFPTAARSFATTTASTAGDGNSRDVWVLAGSLTTTGVTVSRQSAVDGFYWIAIGY